MIDILNWSYYLWFIEFLASAHHIHFNEFSNFKLVFILNTFNIIPLLCAIFIVSSGVSCGVNFV